MKTAPLYHALKKENWAVPVIVHTGQHYDVNMSDAFFSDLQLPEPHIHLGVGSGSHAEQTGNVMIAYEKILKQETPDLVVVVGDVNSTMAATIAAVKLGIKVAHLEAGLRSFDRSMPEEINRIVTDSIADFLWTPSPDGDVNLRKEGIHEDKIIRVGNIMIDSLEMLREKIEKQAVFEKYHMQAKNYGVVTLHRPSNVDDKEKLSRLVDILVRVSKMLPLVFPVHPRTRKNLEKFNLLEKLQAEERLTLSEPLSYINFMNLVFNCCLSITDSGGIQEETTYIGVPCLTLRDNTERPVTVTQGTNLLCNLDNVEEKVTKVINEAPKQNSIPDLWDGKTAKRVVNSIASILNG